MDRNGPKEGFDESTKCFNWATSSQKWIAVRSFRALPHALSFQLGHFFAEMDSIDRINDNLFFDEGFNWATSSQKWIGQHAGSDFWP